MFARHLAEFGLTPDPVLDEDMIHFARHYASPHGILLLAIDGNGTAVGMAGLRRGEFRRIFVEPSVRRLRIATRLLETLLEQAPCPLTGRFRAIIARQNRPSQRLFIGLGFRASIAIANPGQPADCDLYEREVTTIQSRRPPAGLAA